MRTLSDLWNSIQWGLFPWLEEELGPLTEKQRNFVMVVELMAPQPFMARFRWCGNGRPPKERLYLLKAFIYKAVHGFADTALLVAHLRETKTSRRLCGWESRYEIPSLATFSRAFAQFAETGVLAEIHQAMIKSYYGQKVAGHVSRDGTAVSAREKPLKKEPKPPKQKRKRGRPKKGEARAPKEPKRLDLQSSRSLSENLMDLPRACDIGSKKNSKGHCEHWIGYKLHADVIDGDIPVSAVLTSPSVHDSQVAIPLAQMTAGRVVILYHLMDSAYDCGAIRRFVLGAGQVPIIDKNKRRGKKVPMDPAEDARYNQRTSVERVFSMLKDSYGGRQVRVRGPEKVMAHLMLGVLVITAMQLVRLL